MSAQVKHPSSGSVLNVADKSVDVYVAAGWIKVDAAPDDAAHDDDKPAQDDDKPAKKTPTKHTK